MEFDKVHFWNPVFHNGKALWCLSRLPLASLGHFHTKCCSTVLSTLCCVWDTVQLYSRLQWVKIGTGSALVWSCGYRFNLVAPIHH